MSTVSSNTTSTVINDLDSPTKTIVTVVDPNMSTSERLFHVLVVVAEAYVRELDSDPGDGAVTLAAASGMSNVEAMLTGLADHFPAVTS